MKKNIFPLEPNGFYHIYNRGINGGQLFFNDQNYAYFLKLIRDKISPVAEIHSYCLLQNHFHLLVKIRDEHTIRKVFIEKEKRAIHSIISQQFSNTFNSYSQAINKHFGRTGKLFELPFRRKEITSEMYLINSILYINANPVKHKIALDLFSYKYSSINELINEEAKFIEIKKVIDLFENKENFIQCLKNYTV